MPSKSKYDDMPLQEFIIQRYTTARSGHLTKFQAAYRPSHAKGVWVIFCNMVERSGWRACRRARERHAYISSTRIRIRAIPTFKHQQTSPKLLKELRSAAAKMKPRYSTVGV